MDSTRFLARVFAIVLIASGMLYWNVDSLVSQDDQASQDDQKSEESVGSMIQKAYESSTTAKTHKDYSLTIKLCDQVFEKNPSEKQQAYLKTLKSWALVSRAQLFPSTKKDKATKATVVDKPSIQLAIQDCNEAIALDPANWKAYAHRAKRQLALGDQDSAIKDLGVAIRRQPAEGRLWFNRAELLYAQEKYEVAVSDYTEAIKLKPNDVQALTGRAHSYMRIGKPDLAMSDYDDVVEFARKSPTAYLNRAELHLRMKNFKLAGDDYRQALTRDQTLAQAYRGVAWMYATSMKDNYYNPTVADRSVKRAIELDGKETTTNLVVLAAAQAAAGEYTMARDTMKRVRADKQMSKDDREKLVFLEDQKWFRAGTGSK